MGVFRPKRPKRIADNPSGHSGLLPADGVVHAADSRSLEVGLPGLRRDVEHTGFVEVGEESLWILSGGVAVRGVGGSCPLLLRPDNGE